MKKIVFILVFIANLSLFSQNNSDDVYVKDSNKKIHLDLDSLLKDKKDKSILLKENKFYEYEIQKNIAAKDLEISGKFLISSQAMLILGGALMGISIGAESRPLAIVGGVVASTSIPLIIFSGAKQKKAANELKKASFYNLE